MFYQGIGTPLPELLERDAIVLFLDRYWDVNVVHGRHLPDAIEYILQRGANYGVAVREDYVEEEIRSEMIGKEPRQSEFHRTTAKVDRRPVYNIDPLKKEIAENRIISAAPQGYERFKQEHGSDDFFDREEVLEFTGAPLHNNLFAHCQDFPTALKCGEVLHKVGNNGSPLTALVGATFLQGMSIGYTIVDQKYNSLLEELRNDRTTNKAGSFS